MSVEISKKSVLLLLSVSRPDLYIIIRAEMCELHMILKQSASKMALSAFLWLQSKMLHNKKIFTG